MTKRPNGRPKSPHPRNVRVMVRFTQAEAAQLSRVRRPGETLAALIRRCILSYMMIRLDLA